MLAHICRRMFILLLAGALALAAPLPTAEALRSDTIDVAVIAFNDFHGNLLPPGGSVALDPSETTTHRRVPAGGVEHLASLVRRLREENPHHVVVAAGDLVGASPIASSLLHDEPTIAALDALGLEVSSVGNHEFDHGVAELKRLQFGGCHPHDGCRDGEVFAGARFHYLAANVIEVKTGKTLFPPYFVKRFDGIPVAFIGVVLRGTRSIVSPSGVASVRFRDEAVSINALVPELKRQGIEAIVALIHEGGETTGEYNDPSCAGFRGAIVDIAQRLDPAVNAIVSGHTHQPYVCHVGNRLVTQAGSYGRYLTELHLTLDRRTRDVIGASARNHVVDATTLTKDAQETAIVARAETRTAPIAQAPVGRLARAFTRVPNRAGESALGDLIADAQLAATTPVAKGGAQIALTNPGGMRADLVGDGGAVTFGDVFAAQPFGNALIVMDLTGAQLQRVLEQQWRETSDKPRLLQVSHSLTYIWDAARPMGARIVPDSLKIGGQIVRPDKTYRVTVNSFLAQGGDGFTVFRAGTRRLGGPLDADALRDYIRARGTVDVAATPRILRLH